MRHVGAPHVAAVVLAAGIVVFLACSACVAQGQRSLREGSPSADAATDSLSASSTTRTTAASLGRPLAALLAFYVTAVVTLTLSTRAQRCLTYLHWINPPHRLFPLTNLNHHRLANNGRNVCIAHLRGWHILPPGAPFIPSDATDPAFDARLRERCQRVVVFFHGNSGNRAFPSKRVHLVKLLNAHLGAHILVCDYSGFGDSLGAPSQQRFHADARLVLEWLRSRIHHSSSLFVYGQSLGSFAATHVAAHFSQTPSTHPESIITSFDDDHDDDDDVVDVDVDVDANETRRILSTDPESDAEQPHPIDGLILDAPPASLLTAAQTHPITKPFRLVGLTRLFSRILHEDLDSTAAITQVEASILVLHGRHDFMIPPWQGRLLADRARDSGNPRVRFVEFDHVGHVDVSGANGYLHTLYDFVRSCETRRYVGPSQRE